MSVVVFPSYESRRVIKPRIIDSGLRLKLGSREWCLLLCSVCQGTGSGWLAAAPICPRARCAKCAADFPVITWEQAEEWGFLDVPEGVITIAIDAFLEQIAPRHE